jgi:hypothetical protein
MVAEGRRMLRVVRLDSAQAESGQLAEGGGVLVPAESDRVGKSAIASAAESRRRSTYACPPSLSRSTNASLRVSKYPRATRLSAMWGRPMAGPAAWASTSGRPISNPSSCSRSTIAALRSWRPPRSHSRRS